MRTLSEPANIVRGVVKKHDVNKRPQHDVQVIRVLACQDIFCILVEIVFVLQNWRYIQVVLVYKNLLPLLELYCNFLENLHICRIYRCRKMQAAHSPWKHDIKFIVNSRAQLTVTTTFHSTFLHIFLSFRLQTVSISRQNNSSSCLVYYDQLWVVLKWVS